MSQITSKDWLVLTGGIGLATGAIITVVMDWPDMDPRSLVFWIPAILVSCAMGMYVGEKQEAMRATSQERVKRQ